MTFSHPRAQDLVYAHVNTGYLAKNAAFRTLECSMEFFFFCCFYYIGVRGPQ